jgi:hypothetical protein
LESELLTTLKAQGWEALMATLKAQGWEALMATLKAQGWEALMATLKAQGWEALMATLKVHRLESSLGQLLALEVMVVPSGSRMGFPLDGWWGVMKALRLASQ